MSTTPFKVVYTVQERAKRKLWLRIGTAFVNRDGSLTVRLDALPLSGTLIIRDPDPKESVSQESVPLTPVPHVSELPRERALSSA